MYSLGLFFSTNIRTERSKSDVSFTDVATPVFLEFSDGISGVLFEPGLFRSKFLGSMYSGRNESSVEEPDFVAGGEEKV